MPSLTDNDIRDLFASHVPDDSEDEYEDDSEERKPSYYKRHKVTLRAKQRHYNYVKRTGRRRVSKADMAVRQRRWQKVIDGERGTYNDTLGWTVGSTRTDDERTEAMAAAEASIYDALHLQRASLRKALDFPLNYCSYLELELEKAKTAEYDEVHAKRRVLAGYAQELNLWRQGEASFRAARGDGVLIFKGNGVNRHSARRILGF